MRYGPMIVDCLLVARGGVACFVSSRGVARRMKGCLGTRRVGVRPCSRIRGCLEGLGVGDLLLGPSGAGCTVCSTVGPTYGVVCKRSPMALLGTIHGRRRVTKVRTTVRQSKITLMHFLG